MIEMKIKDLIKGYIKYMRLIPAEAPFDDEGMLIDNNKTSGKRKIKEKHN
ncbi:MAG: hypothetical protein ACXVHO_03940 [Methanobacterium sp.]